MKVVKLKIFCNGSVESCDCTTSRFQYDVAEVSSTMSMS